jgi:hypothetical protein
MKGEGMPKKPQAKRKGRPEPAVPTPAEKDQAKEESPRRGLSLEQVANLVLPGGPSEKY